MIYCLEKKQRTQLLLLYNLTKKIANLLEIIYLLIGHYFWKKYFLRNENVRCGFHCGYYASEWHKGWKTTTNTPHTYVAEESIPLYCLKKPPSPPKRVPFPFTKHPPLPPSPFSYKSLLLSRERKATGIYIIKISLDIQRSLRGFSNRFKISVLGGLLL